MNQSFTMSAQVLGLSRYATDTGFKGCNVFVVQDSAGKSENRLGQEVMTAKADYELFEDFRDYADDMPCNLQLEVQMRPGAKGALVLYILAVSAAPAPAKPPVPGKPVDAGKSGETK